MCLIVYKPAGERFDYKILRAAYVNNPDGVGYLVRIGRELYTDKGLWTWKRLKRMLKALAPYECAVHFRYATHGEVSAANCHPFHTRHWSMVHNGCVPGFGGVDQSDTKEFAEFLDMAYGAEAPHAADDWFRAVGGSKFVFAERAYTPFVIVGEHLGTWRKNVWYSNMWSFPSSVPMYLKYRMEPIRAREVDISWRDKDIDDWTMEDYNAWEAYENRDDEKVR